ncbi:MULTISPECIES: PLP-dependent aminotransferase family protein [Pseudoalteromonas]|uniref:GntR family transcriptional regulator n=1 Tax=Pseudoalteromonas amylolytica TaxID=1859457 RepID=A0A1S1MQC1_9GAMM|nr:MULTISPECIES: PLP-dependent aminotransferase family protein [Pseudoalteromonas]OHU84302.1 GntR family transcriptional regulator [Pseudoalteromonas sp. JW3]OHU87159.1 GntR family transcriptional regulator [Pseudoalteromonas amylolytica]
MHPIVFEAQHNNEAIYLQLAGALREAIKAGKLVTGTKLSSARAMAPAYQLNRHTVMNALQLLVAEGWLEAKEKSGYFVTHTLPIDSSAQHKKQPKYVPKQLVFAQPMNDPVTAELAQYKYNFAGGLPDIEKFPFIEFKRAMSNVCQRVDAKKLHYGAVGGENELKLQVQVYLQSARNLRTEDLVICNGSQEALFLTARVFISPGDYVACETLGYPPARKAFSACGARIIDIHQDEQGLCVADLETQLQRYSIKLLYLTPLHQYPTTVTLSPTRRLQIYQLCYQYGGVIIEDDYDHEFHYRCQPLQPMASDDPAGIVIYISTFSKIMFAGARVGYICARKQILEQIRSHKQLINHKNDVLTQLSVAQWMQTGQFERHLKRMTKLYKSRSEAMAGELAHYQKVGLPLRFIYPDGGMAMWVDCGVNVLGVKALAGKHGIYLQTQDEFYYANSERSLQPSATAITHIRLGFAGQNTAHMSQGLQQLMQLIYPRYPS